MIANVPSLLFWSLIVAMVVASFWWNPRRTKFQGGIKRYAAACVVHALFSYALVISAAVLTIENRGNLDKEKTIWIFVAIMIASMVLREIAKKVPVVGPLLVEFDLAAAANSSVKTNQRLET
jgi:RsiW-degrading membrane proteinase PrsW (M82 family)